MFGIAGGEKVNINRPWVTVIDVRQPNLPLSVSMYPIRSLSYGLCLYTLYDTGFVLVSDLNLLTLFTTRKDASLARFENRGKKF